MIDHSLQIDLILIGTDLFDNPVTFVAGYKSTIIDLLPKLRVLDRKSNTAPAFINDRLFLFVLAISNDGRAQAFDDCHPDRRKILDRFGFAFNLERKSNEDPSKKKLPVTSTHRTTKPLVQIQENEPKTSSPE